MAFYEDTVEFWLVMCQKLRLLPGTPYLPTLEKSESLLKFVSHSFNVSSLENLNRDYFSH